MFKRYWREYPLFLQLVLLLLMFFTLWSFSLYLGGVLIPRIFQVPLTALVRIDEHMSRRALAAAISFQAVNHLFSFLVTGLLFSYLTHPQPAFFLGLRKPGKRVHPWLVALIILGALPFLTGLDGLLRHIDFGPSVKAMQERNDATLKAFLTQKGAGDFLASFFVFAILPALGEEMLFRGIFMRYVAKRTQKMLYPILISGILFALFHSNPYGMLSIFLAGIIMGVIYWLTGSLWMSILGHLLFNGTQVTLYYAANNNPSLNAFLESNRMPLLLPVAGALVMGLGLYLLWRTRTPLPTGWTDDFTADEKAEPEEQTPFQ